MADDKKIVIPKKEFIEEHKQLLDVLDNPTDKKLQEEHDEQAKEAEEMAGLKHKHKKTAKLKRVKKSESELEKGVKEVAAAAAIAMSPASIGHSSMPPTIAQKVSSAQAVSLHPDLHHIAFIESSGGKNKNHAMTTVGLNAGHTAGGATGLMPLTVKETIKKNPKLNKKFGHLVNASHDSITKEINANPRMEVEIANHHWNRLDKVFGGHRARMAYAWRNGITAAKRASAQEIFRHPYVQKFLSESARSKVAMAKSELAKMSRPSITFPRFKKLNSRPDQEVQQIESPRQQKLFGLKVANAELAGIAPNKHVITPGSRKIETKEAAHASYGKRIAGGFNRRTLGLEAPTKQGPKSAALVGKMRSKFEVGDKEYSDKIKEHGDKRMAVIQDYNRKLSEWRKKATEILDRPHDPNYHSDWAAHQAARPAKPKMPRKPSKTKVETSKLSPERQKARGQSVDSTIHHEGFHHTMEDMSRKYGRHIASRVHSKLMSHYNPDTLSAVGTYIHTRMGYKIRSPKFTEEILAHSRDILVNREKRESFKSFVGNEEKFKEHIKNLKQGHQKAYAWAQSAKPEDFEKSLEKIASLGHSLPGPGTTGAAALLKETMGQVKRKLRKRKTSGLEKAIADLEEAEALTKAAMDKSNYGPAKMQLYNQADNARRKMDRQHEEFEIGPNKAVHATSLSAKQQADLVAREARQKSKSNPVKIFSDEEKKQLEAQMQKPPQATVSVTPQAPKKKKRVKPKKVQRGKKPRLKKARVT